MFPSRFHRTITNVIKLISSYITQTIKIDTDNGSYIIKIYVLYIFYSTLLTKLIHTHIYIHIIDTSILTLRH